MPPDELRAKVSVFANIFIKAEALAARAREVQTSADQLRLLTDAAPIGIFQTDAANRYVYTNPRWTEITGIPAEEAVGREWDTIIDAEALADLVAELPAGAVRRAELRHRFELRRSGRDPTDRARDLEVDPGRRRRHRGLGRHAGRRHRGGRGRGGHVRSPRHRPLRRARCRRTSPASASHELRTPTTSILGFVEEVLENDALSEEDRGFLQIVHRNAQRLSQLIDDLLILGEAEIGASMMHLEPTALVPLVERVMSSFSATAQRAGITLATRHEPDPPSALVDPLRLEQALTNLISNALEVHAERWRGQRRHTRPRRECRGQCGGHRRGHPSDGRREHLRSLLPGQDRGRHRDQGQRARPRDREADDRGPGRRDPRVRAGSGTGRPSP